MVTWWCHVDDLILNPMGVVRIRLPLGLELHDSAQLVLINYCGSLWIGTVQYTHPVLAGHK